MKKLTLKYVKAEALKRGGKCLSKTYINAKTKLLFECKRKHQWRARWNNIQNGQWCYECSIIERWGENYKANYTIKDMQAIAKSRGGKCLSKEYKNAHTKLVWQCKLKHKWKAEPYSIKNLGTWCPHCCDGIGERICRLIFETIFKRSFPKIRPKWLRNPKTGANLELDGFCKKLGIAFEYNGGQHYNDIGIYNRAKYDKIKKQLCKKNGIKLFVIKEIKKLSKYNNIIDDIILQSKKLNIKIKYIPKININSAYNTDESQIKLAEIKKIAKKRGGVCLSTIYISSNIKLDFKCNKCKNIWPMTPDNIKSGQWCPPCSKAKGSKKRILTISVYQEVAKKKGGQCLSKKVKSCRDKLRWKCAKNHIWKATACEIKNSDQWCPECAKLKPILNKNERLKFLRKAQKIATKKGGKCISKEYINNYSHMKWKCKKGHKWDASYANIVYNDSWCPECAKLNRSKK